MKKFKAWLKVLFLLASSIVVRQRKEGKTVFQNELSRCGLTGIELEENDHMGFFFFCMKLVRFPRLYIGSFVFSK